MKLTPLAIPGAALVEVEPLEDERGVFARTFCADEFAAAGLPVAFVQCSTSFSPRKGQLRGMHYQKPPHAEGRLVRCTRGAVYDVMLDLRRGSPMYRKWLGYELSADNRRAVYIPPGCAHGFVTMEAASEVYYQMTVRYRADHGAGVRWNDPAFGIAWPEPHPLLSPRDAAYPDWSDAGAL